MLSGTHTVLFYLYCFLPPGGTTSAGSSAFVPLANNNHAVHTIQKVARKTPTGKHHCRKLAVGGIVRYNWAIVL